MTSPITRAWLLALVVVAAGAAGCSGGPSVHDDTGAPRDGDRSVRLGNYEKAIREYRQGLVDDPDNPVLKEKLRNAQQLAARSWAGHALRAADQGLLDEAAAHLARASELAPTLPYVRRAQASIVPRIAGREDARRLHEEADRVFESDPERARDLLAQARVKSPDDATIILALKRATLRAEAERAAVRAVAAWDAGDRDRVAEELLDARYRGATVPLARELIDDIQKKLRSELHPDRPAAARADWQFAVRIGADTETLKILRRAASHRLRLRAAELLEAGRPATAAILELDAERMGVEEPMPALDRVRNETTLRVVVQPFEDATGGDVDGIRLARAVAEQIQGDSREGGVVLDVAGPDAPASAADLVLTGRVTGHNTGRHTAGRARETVAVQVGTRTEPGPGMERLSASLAEVQDEVREAAEEWRDAADELRRIRDMPFIHPTRGGRARLGRDYYAKLLNKAEHREDRARRDLEETQQAELMVREQIRRVQGHVEIPVFEDRERVVTKIALSADLTAHVRLVAGGETVLDQPVTGSVRLDETIAPGFPDGGVPADLDESPDDVELARRAAAHFARLTSGLVRAKAESAARPHLTAARAAEQAGDRDAAAEHYARFLLSTTEVATPERADAARAFREITGYDVPLVTGGGSSR